jgi:hypothetical protein
MLFKIRFFIKFELNKKRIGKQKIEKVEKNRKIENRLKVRLYW